MSEVTYSKKNDEIECVRYEKSRKTYLPHTHTNHLTIGYIEDGKVCITIDGESCIYTQGDEFRIMPNVLHEVKPADENPYSMVVMCIRTDAVADDDNLKELQDTITISCGTFLKNDFFDRLFTIRPYRRFGIFDIIHFG